MPVVAERTRAAFALLISILAAFGVPRPALAQPGPQQVLFDIPRGAAENSLKIFSQQSGCGVICVTGDVAGVITNPVRGKFTPADAIEHMLAGTVLTAAQDEQTRAFAVRVRPPSGKCASPCPRAGTMCRHGFLRKQTGGLARFRVVCRPAFVAGFGLAVHLIRKTTIEDPPHPWNPILV